MKRLISMLVKDISKNEDEFKVYFSLRNHDGWKMHLRHLEKLRLLMSVDMLSGEHTKLTPEEKDVRQRTYAGINEVINFLINPFEQMEKKAKLKMVEDKVRREKSAFKPHTGATFGKTK